MEPIRPSRVAYLIPAAIALAGIVGFVWVLLDGITSLSNSMIHVTVPGRQELELADAGTYTVFHEYESAFSSRTFAPDPPDVECSLTNSRNEAVPLGRATASSTYSFGNRAGISILEFSVTQPGRHEFACDYEDKRTEPKAVFAIVHGFGTSLVRTVLLCLGLIGSFLIAVLATVQIYWKRRKAREAAASSPERWSSNTPIG